MDSINVNIQYTPEDLQKSFLLYYKHYYPVRSKLLLILGIVLVVVGIFLVLLETFKRSETAFFTFLAWFFIAYGICVVLLYVHRIRTLGKKIFNKMPDFKSPYSYSITGKQLTIKGASISSDVAWTHYQDAIITPDMILLFPNKLRFNLFPKRCFTEAEFQQLTAWAVRVKK